MKIISCVCLPLFTFSFFYLVKGIQLEGEVEEEERHLRGGGREQTW